MEPDVKKILEALLLSTADPISLRDLVKLFNRYHEELLAAISDEGDEEDESPTVPAKIGEAELRHAITSLMEAAEQEDRAYRVVEGAFGLSFGNSPAICGFCSPFAWGAAASAFKSCCDGDDFNSRLSAAGYSG